MEYKLHAYGWGPLISSCFRYRVPFAPDCAKNHVGMEFSMWFGTGYGRGFGGSGTGFGMEFSMGFGMGGSTGFGVELNMEFRMECSMGSIWKTTMFAKKTWTREIRNKTIVWLYK